MVQRGTSLNENKDVKNLILGGIAGCVSRTVIAPLDKIKILMQFRKTNLTFTNFLKNNIKKEGVLNLWKGNGINLLRIFPFSGLQFFTYDICKRNIQIRNESKNIQRLLNGSITGIVATSFTHPFDVIKHRLLCYENINTFKKASIDIYKENNHYSVRNFYKGYGSTIFSMTPFIAINFATFDYLKDNTPEFINKDNPLTILSLGATSALIGQIICFPLDTIRRRMQHKENIYKDGFDACKKIIKNEGYLSFYKGLVPNILRMVPNTAIRFSLFEFLKEYIK